MQVVARMDLSERAPWVDKLPKAITAAARSVYPVMEIAPLSAINLQIETDQSGSKASTLQGEAKEWVFRNVDRTRSLRIGPAWVTVVCDGRFESYEESIESGLSPVWDAMQAECPMPRRLGLRYINNIPQIAKGRDSTDWAKVVKSNVSAVLKAPNPHGNLVRAVGVTEYNYDDHILRFQFGMHNPDYPGPLTRPLFLLDYDCWTDSLIDQSEVLSRLRGFRDDILQMFLASISSDLRRDLQKK